jgi:hypothetical protein
LNVAVADEVLAPLANEAMRARRRPGVIVAVWIWETLAALPVSFPAYAAARSAYGEHPLQDAPLWAPGSESLMQLCFSATHARAALAASTALALAFAAALGAVPLGATLVSIAFATRDRRAPPWSRLLAQTARAVLSLTGVGALTLLAQLLVLGGGVLLGVLAAAATSGAGEARADMLAAVIVAVSGAGALFVGVSGDLARAALVRFRVPVLAALGLAWKAIRGVPLATFLSWAWRALTALLLVGGGALAADRLGGRGGAALLFLALCHQGVILARVSLRASWLAKALRIVDRMH